jgi:hypothetical protein
MAEATETKAQLRVREITARDALKNTLDMAVGNVEALAGGTPEVDGPPGAEFKLYYNRGLLFPVGGRWYKASIRAYDPTEEVAGGND